MNEIVLGFDISSKTIGWCALEINKNESSVKYIACGHIKPSKNGSILDRILETRSQVLEIIKKYQPNYIGIEDIIKFMKGKSSAQTIITLTTFNRMICLASYDYLQHSPELFSVMTIRHGLKLNKILPKKEDMPELVAKHLGIKFPYIFNKKQKIKEESYDTADGVAVALYYAMKLTNKIVKKTKKLKKDKK